MELMITRFIETVLFPPGIVFVLWFAGLMLLRRSTLPGEVLLWLGLLGGYFLSTPYGAVTLLRPLEAQYPALNAHDIERSDAGAIVVLAAGLYRSAPEFGNHDSVSEETLMRLRYAAHLHRLTDLPVIVSGGVVESQSVSLAVAMATSLREEFGVTNIWLEAQSLTTAENAKFTQELLKSRGIKKIYLVTHAAHMPRSVEIFKRVGAEVIPAPTRFFANEVQYAWWRAVLPSAGAWELTRAALHEWVGRGWYALRHHSV